jgi:SAM-dependent methyltransferase
MLMGFRARRVSSYLSSLPAHPPRGSCLLDLGCGDGSVSSALSRRLSLRVTGADVTLQRRRHVPTIRYDGLSLPFPDRSFDCTLLVWVLHHTPDPGAVLREAARVTRDRILVMEVNYRTPFQKALLKAIDWTENRPSGINVPLNFHTISEWESIFQESGLSVESVRPGFRVSRLDPTKNVLFVLRPFSSTL